METNQSQSKKTPGLDNTDRLNLIEQRMCNRKLLPEYIRYASQTLTMNLKEWQTIKSRMIPTKTAATVRSLKTCILILLSCQLKPNFFNLSPSLSQSHCCQALCSCSYGKINPGIQPNQDHQGNNALHNEHDRHEDLKNESRDIRKLRLLQT